MNRTFHVVGHAVVLALACFLTLRGSGTGKGVPATSDYDPHAKSEVLVRERKSGARPTDQMRSARGWAPAEYEAAWADLPAMRLCRSEREWLQRRLLQGWAEIDLESALAAALREAWDLERPTSNNPGLVFLNGLREAFLDQTPAVWRIIDDKRLGFLESALLRKMWSETVASTDPQLVLPYLASLDSISLEKAVSAMHRKCDTPEKTDLVWDALSRLEPGEDLFPALHSAALVGSSNYSAEELRERLSSDSENIRILATCALARQIEFKDPAMFQEELSRIPEVLRDEFAFVVMNISWYSGVLPETLSVLFEGGHWDKVAGSQAGGMLQFLGETGDAAAIADWIIQLPDREETEHLIVRGVTPFIEQDPEAAWEWLATLEENSARDHAYAAYSQLALEQLKDPERAHAALQHIRSPEIHARAIEAQPD